MKKFLWVFLLVFFLAGCNNPWKKDDRLVVVSTIYPLKDIVEQIGGNRVRSEVLIPPGSSVHTYEPKPSDVQKMVEADIVLVVGAGLDDWAKKIALDSGVDQDKFIDVSQLVELRNFPDSSEEKGKADPHYWLSPKRVQQFFPKLTEEMIKKDGANKIVYETNSNEFTVDLKKIDEEIVAAVEKFSSKDIVTFHEGFGYLAADYGLNVVGTIEPVSGSEPTAAQIQNIIDQIKNLQIKAVFSEPQLSSKVTETIKNDLGIEVGVLDPLGGIEGRGTYISLMKYNLLELKRFLD
ncbi:MAG: metal ABC transporter substrate-binding protein [Patescibacteria group bacterium]